MKEFSIIRDLNKRETFIVECLLEQNAIRVFKAGEFVYAIHVKAPDNCIIVPIKEYLSRNNEIAQFLQSNKKELVHKEQIKSITGESIDRSLAHLLGDITYDGKNYRHIITTVFATISYKGTPYILGQYRNDGFNLTCSAGHVSHNETVEEAVLKEIKEELGLNIAYDRLTPISTISMKEKIKETKVNAEEIACFYTRLNESDIPSIRIDEEDVYGLLLISSEELFALKEGKEISPKYIIEEGVVKEFNHSNLSAKDASKLVNPEYFQAVISSVSEDL